MKTFLTLLCLVVITFYFTSCSEDPTQLRVNNLNSEKVNISFKPDRGSTIDIDNVAAGALTEYINISPTPGGTISASMISANPEDIRCYAIAGNRYLITLSAGNNPTLSWKKE